MNKHQADAIRDRIRDENREIRVLCPRGHFIAHIGLYVADDSPTEPVRMHPRGPNKQYVGDLSEGHHGFRMDTHHPSQSYNVQLTCTNRRCNYTGAFNFILLGLDLAAHALAGHAEHQLTN